ncbi:MAG: zinc ribbon domain-containing protein, partial [Candidatus Pacebacteria bacterium]|nr:zinc ribbon domain-containing protein [Candidatus Paceibacterota bacterium]
KDEWVPVPVPPIITKVQFEIARKQIEENKKNSPRRTIREYLFAKKLHCGICGGVMVAQCRAGKTDVKFYICHRRSKEHAPVLCSQKSIAETRIEPPVWEAIKKLLMQPDVTLNELETLKGKDDHRQALMAKQAQTEKQLKQLESRLERLLDLYVDGAIKKMAFLERSRNLEREKDSLTKKGTELSQELISEEERAFKAESIKKLYKQIGKNLEEADYETKRFVISLLINRISVNADRLDVECHIPDRFLEGEKNIHVSLCRNPLIIG